MVGGSVGSPQTDTDEAGGRLREDLADAMLETQLGSGESLFILYCMLQQW